MKIAKRVKNLKPSVGFELLKLAQNMKAKGEDVISLAIGELQGKSYKSIRIAGQKAIEEGHTKYTPAAGTQELRTKLAQRASKQFNLDLDFENVLVSHGTKYALYTVFQSLCSAGDEVLLPAPYWLSYPQLISLSGANTKIIESQAEKGFKVTAQQLESAISPKTRIFLLNSPNNPSSAVYTDLELIALGEVLRKHPQVMVLIDSIYDLLVYSQPRPAPHLLQVCPDLKNQILALNGASKTYLMTGWRLGWLIGPKDYVKIFYNFQSQSLSCCNSIAQKAFEIGSDNCELEILKTIEELAKIRDLLIENLIDIPELDLYPSQGAFYLWVGVKKAIGKKYKGQSLKSSKEIMQKLLEEHKLLCICGEEFGMGGYLRLSYVVDENTIEEASKRLKAFFSLLT